MAIVASFGPLLKLAVSDTSGSIEVDDLNTGPEKFQLWSNEVSGAQDRVTQSLWVSLCREAMVHGWPVVVTADNENSAQVVSIMLQGG
jgi:hypothetical protein